MIGLQEYINNKENNFKVDNIEVSKSILTKCFECDLNKCKGCCCVSGNEGARITNEEAKTIEIIFPEVEHLLSEKALEKIQNNGLTYREGNDVFVQTTSNNNGTCSCIFAINENGINLCAIDKMFRNENKKLRELNFPKPISCSLYPIKQDGNKLVYDIDKRCKCISNPKIPLYVSQEKALTKCFGKAWYDKLKLISNNV